MKRMKVLMLGAFLLLRSAAGAQTVDEIMSRHVKALGGADSWNKIKTLKMTGGFSQGGVDIDITQTIAMGKAMRTDVSAMGVSGFQIVTTKDGWSYMPFTGSARLDTMKPEVVRSFQKQMDVKSHQLMDYKTAGLKAEYTGKDTVANAACYKIRFTDKEGTETTSYFDCNTYYILRTDTKVKQDEQEQEVSVVYNDYKKLDGGIVMPLSVNAGGVNIAFKSIEVNRPVDNKVFLPQIPK